MAYGEYDKPPFSRYYMTGLLASVLAYLGLLLLFTVITAMGTSDASTVFSVFFLGGVYMAIPGAVITLVITAPLGAMFGIAMREWLPPGHWHGAVNGAATASLILIVLFVLIGELRIPDAETVATCGTMIGICALSGWWAQRKVLNWPNDEALFDPSVFE
ncbi:MAG: hypothetical protein SXU28_05255 [Pseudomonadota bacterium]|nr:hypothetical protein [Pseudomonadota bacterium]